MDKENKTQKISRQSSIAAESIALLPLRYGRTDGRTGGRIDGQTK